MKLNVEFRWYDLWVGVFIKQLEPDNTVRHVYVCPFCCIVLHFQFRRRLP